MTFNPEDTEIGQSMKGFTNGDLELLRGESAEQIMEWYSQSSKPFFTEAELEQWLEEAGLR
jgi:hypothetical protein